jgi:hypothetical protein
VPLLPAEKPVLLPSKPEDYAFTELFAPSEALTQQFREKIVKMQK